MKKIFIAFLTLLASVTAAAQMEVEYKRTTDPSGNVIETTRYHESTNQPRQEMPSQADNPPASATPATKIMYVSDSFRNTDAGNRLENDGKENVTAQFSEFAPSHDDAEIKSAIIRVKFRNIAESEYLNIAKATVQSGGFVNKIEFRPNTLKEQEMWVHVDPGDNLILAINVPAYGMVRIPDLKVKSGEIYELEVQSNEKRNVSIWADMEGTVIYFDGRPAGTFMNNKPVSIPGVSMGKHTVKDVCDHRVVEDKDFEVTSTNVTKYLTMKQKYTVRISCDTKDTYAYEGETSLGELPQTLEMTEGKHIIRLQKSGYAPLTHEIMVTEQQNNFKLKMYYTKDIEFFAISNNTRKSDVDVYINGEFKGKTPCRQQLEFGKYTIRMSSDGLDKSGELTVNENTPSNYSLTLPTRFKRFNPFAIEYRKRPIGLAVGYVEKWFQYTEGQRINSINYISGEKHMKGIQVGISIQPYFNYGIGLNTGVYYEGYFTSLERDSSLEQEIGDLTEHCLYVPLGIMFRLPLHQKGSIFIKGGGALDYSVAIAEQIGEDKQDYNFDYNAPGAPNRLNLSCEFGGGFQYRTLQGSITYQIGLTNNKRLVEDGYKARLRKLALQLAFTF